ncbi:hypothetical protein BC2230_120086 [Burkholderia cepacia]
MDRTTAALKGRERRISWGETPTECLGEQVYGPERHPGNAYLGASTIHVERINRGG